jgi:hypothetical protein
MRSLIFVAAVLSLAACKSDYSERMRDNFTATPPANPTGSVGYQQPGMGQSGRMDSVAPGNPTGSVGYQGSGGGSTDRITGAPPRNPTGSAGYQH